jgi:hypothetical protein
MDGMSLHGLRRLCGSVAAIVSDAGGVCTCFRRVVLPACQDDLVLGYARWWWLALGSPGTSQLVDGSLERLVGLVCVWHPVCLEVFTAWQRPNKWVCL